MHVDDFVHCCSLSAVGLKRLPWKSCYQSVLGLLSGIFICRFRALYSFSEPSFFLQLYSIEYVKRVNIHNLSSLPQWKVTLRILYRPEWTLNKHGIIIFLFANWFKRNITYFPLAHRPAKHSVGATDFTPTFMLHNVAQSKKHSVSRMRSPSVLSSTSRERQLNIDW